MRERPILFRPELVREILAGRKTQTRRPVKPRLGDPEFWEPRRPGVWDYWHPDINDTIEIACPYGSPGDRLWVREAFAHDGSANRIPDACWFRADPCTRDAPGVPCEHGPERWTSPLHMPRWASRLLLEVTEVRVERLRAITEEDARAEGMEFLFDSSRDATPRDTFLRRWDAMYGAGDFATARSPWVWVVSFRVCPGTGTEGGE